MNRQWNTNRTSPKEAKGRKKKSVTVKSYDCVATQWNPTVENGDDFTEIREAICKDTDVLELKKNWESFFEFQNFEEHFKRLTGKEYENILENFKRECAALVKFLHTRHARKKIQENPDAIETLTPYPLIMEAEGW